MSYHAAFHYKITSHHEELPIVPVVDAHLHFVDFIQESDGIRKLVAAMDAGRITKAVLFGLPVKKKWDAAEKHAPHYYLDDNSRCYYFQGTDEIVAEEFLRLPRRPAGGLRRSSAGSTPRTGTPPATSSACWTSTRSGGASARFSAATTT